MKNSYVMKEYSEAVYPIQLSDEDRHYITKAATIHPNKPWEKRFFLDELKSGVRIQTTSYVGTIELSNCRIIIQPKFSDAFKGVMKMLAFTEGLPFSMSTESSAGHEKNDLFILFATQFMRQAEKILLQLKKEYVTYTDDLTNVRGRIQMLDTVRTYFGLPKGVVCEFDELTHNIEENQIISAILHKIEKHPMFRRDPQLKRLLIQFESICVPYQGKVYPDFVYSRLNQHYKPIHIVGKFLFEGLFVDDFLGKSHTFATVLVNMNELFERFVVQVLKKFLPKSYGVLHGKRLTDAILLNDQSYRHIIPDIVVQHQVTKGTTIIDTKYKGYDQKRIATQDIFQLTFYAQYFQKTPPYRSTIIYPVFEGFTERAVKIDTNKHNVPGEITVQNILIEQLLEWIESKAYKRVEHQALMMVGND
ncbi:McrC family protein [Solibacillus ferritrahens]|uniref:McrC family protein n=1 Tax=Solibacillus ferritrahens TaxID=3098620 RepID=UPI0030087134